MHDQLSDLHHIAKDIDNAWREFDYRAECFADIVLERTADVDFSVFGELSTTMKLLDDAYVGSLQAPSNFSDLYIMLFANSHFYVEMLHWWRSDINIHDHDFSGVQFQVKGKSLNVVYDFDGGRDDGLAEGHLGVRHATLLEPGGRSVVRAGAVDPHIVVHLSEPTISLLIRTQPKPFFAPQRNYFPPGLAADWSLATPIYRKKIAALRFIYEADRRAFAGALRDMLAHGSPSANLFTLERLHDILFEEENTYLLTEYAEQGGLQERTVAAIAKWRGYLFLSDEIKSLPCLELDERLAVAVLMTGLDASGRAKVLRCLSEARVDVGCEKACGKVMAMPNDWRHDRFRKVLTMYGAGELVA